MGVDLEYEAKELANRQMRKAKRDIETANKIVKDIVESIE